MKNTKSFEDMLKVVFSGHSITDENTDLDGMAGLLGTSSFFLRLTLGIWHDSHDLPRFSDAGEAKASYLQLSEKPKYSEEKVSAILGWVMVANKDSEIKELMGIGWQYHTNIVHEIIVMKHIMTCSDFSELLGSYLEYLEEHDHNRYFRTAQAYRNKLTELFLENMEGSKASIYSHVETLRDEYSGDEEFEDEFLVKGCIRSFMISQGELEAYDGLADMLNEYWLDKTDDSDTKEIQAYCFRVKGTCFEAEALQKISKKFRRIEIAAK